jgi:hypothetical protein
MYACVGNIRASGHIAIFEVEETLLRERHFSLFTDDGLGSAGRAEGLARAQRLGWFPSPPRASGRAGKGRSGMTVGPRGRRRALEPSEPQETQESEWLGNGDSDI